MPCAARTLIITARMSFQVRGCAITLLGNMHPSQQMCWKRASGLPPATVLLRYGLRNALLPIVTTLGMVFSFLLGSNVLVEKVFAWPGIGSYAIESLTASDYAPIQGFVLMMGGLYVLLNLLIDIAYSMIDPRVKIEG